LDPFCGGWHGARDRRRRLKLLSILGLCLIAATCEMGRPVIIKYLVDKLIATPINTSVWSMACRLLFGFYGNLCGQPDFVPQR
jgi:hypothetical protein